MPELNHYEASAKLLNICLKNEFVHEQRLEMMYFPDAAKTQGNHVDSCRRLIKSFSWQVFMRMAFITEAKFNNLNQTQQFELDSQWLADSSLNLKYSV